VSGTCEDSHVEPVTTKEDCTEAAQKFGYKVDWGPNDGFKDVVDGCSIRGGTQAFQNTAGTCVLGTSTPDWVPGANGKATCSCTEWQPCLCVRPFLESHWGSAILLILGLTGALYTGGGLALGRSQGRRPAAGMGPIAGRLTVHPHWPQWCATAGLVRDGAMALPPRPYSSHDNAIPISSSSVQPVNSVNSSVHGVGVNFALFRRSSRHRAAVAAAGGDSSGSTHHKKAAAAKHTGSSSKEQKKSSRAAHKHSRSGRGKGSGKGSGKAAGAPSSPSGSETSPASRPDERHEDDDDDDMALASPLLAGATAAAAGTAAGGGGRWVRVTD
jgi:hypothetical protein